MSVSGPPTENNKVTIEITSDMEVEEFQSDHEVEFDENAMETEHEFEYHSEPEKQTEPDDLVARGLAPSIQDKKTGKIQSRHSRHTHRRQGKS